MCPELAGVGMLDVGQATGAMRSIRARGHFPTEQAALKCLYLATRALDPTGRGRARWVIRWKPALNAFAITFEGRLHPTNTN